MMAVKRQSRYPVGIVTPIETCGQVLDGKIPQAVVGDDEHTPISVIVTGVRRAGDPEK